jgi:hypothetical protein
LHLIHHIHVKSPANPSTHWDLIMCK